MGWARDLFASGTSFILSTLQKRYESELKSELEKVVIEKNYWSDWISENRTVLNVAAGTYREIKKKGVRNAIESCVKESKSHWYSSELFEDGGRRQILAIPLECLKRRLPSIMTAELSEKIEFRSIDKKYGQKDIVVRITVEEAIRDAMESTIKSMIKRRVELRIDDYLNCTIAQLKNDDFYFFDDNPNKSFSVRTLIFQTEEGLWKEFKSRRPQNRIFTSKHQHGAAACESFMDNLALFL